MQHKKTTIKVDLCDTNHYITYHNTFSLNMSLLNFTFMLPCIVIGFFLNNQPDALIIQILFCYKTLHVLGNLFAPHQEFSTVHSALVSCMQFLNTISKQSQDGSSILTLLGNGHQKLHATYLCRMYGRELLMRGKEVAQNM